MTLKTTYSRARSNLAALWDEVESSREPVLLERRGHEDMAMLPAQELSALRETAHLLSSPANAARLLAALTRSRQQPGAPVELQELQQRLGLTD